MRTLRQGWCARKSLSYLSFYTQNGNRPKIPLDRNFSLTMLEDFFVRPYLENFFVRPYLKEHSVRPHSLNLLLNHSWRLFEDLFVRPGLKTSLLDHTCRTFPGKSSAYCSLSCSLLYLHMPLHWLPDTICSRSRPSSRPSPIMWGWGIFR